MKKKKKRLRGNSNKFLVGLTLSYFPSPTFVFLFTSEAVFIVSIRCVKAIRIILGLVHCICFHNRMPFTKNVCVQLMQQCHCKLLFQDKLTQYDNT